VEIGNRLIAAKARVGHGNFLAWIEAEFVWTATSADRYMRVAESFPNSSGLTNFTREALYLLAGPAVPEAARAEAVYRSGIGAHPTDAKGVNRVD
jgi:Protein of unknown function (DUF3102)